jgi:multidrug efflux pump subunit AcrA (membrane-fusion protein)
MKAIGFAACGLVLGVVAGYELHSPASAPAAKPQPGPVARPAQVVAEPAQVVAQPAPVARPPDAALVEATGRTKCPLTRRGIVASAILRPVVEVLVSPGDRVKKGQALVKLYDLEPQAKVRAREQDLKSSQAKALYSRKNLELAEGTKGTAAIPARAYNDLRAAALSNDALALAAEADLSHAQAELKLYTVTASIDGEIAWLDVSPGTVSWPGAMMWGEIVDLRELDVRCDLLPILAERVAVGQSAEVALDGKEEPVAALAWFQSYSAWRTLRSSCGPRSPSRSAFKRPRGSD